MRLQLFILQCMQCTLEIFDLNALVIQKKKEITTTATAASTTFKN